MLIIEPIDSRGESRNRLDAQNERVQELAKMRLLWNILIAAIPGGLWITSMLIRSGMEPNTFASSTVSISTVVLQAAALTTTILMHKRYAKKLEQARTELLDLNLEHSRISMEESRENDAA